MGFKSDIEIAQENIKLPIKEVAARYGISEDELELYGKYKAKLSDELLQRVKDVPDGKLVLVTAINPTPAGEGKTTTSIGLADALNLCGHKTMLALREPSLGPCFGIKGGAAGGGYAQVVPMEDLNLHFTGDFHAITSANNLLAAMLDNHINHGNALRIDTRQILHKRCEDMNDRALRNIVIGMGGKANGFVREDHFVITVATEIMAILCMARDMEDLKKRLGDIVVAYNLDGDPVTARDLKAVGSMAALLKDAIKPNMIQTLEHTGAIIHGGPFANIAHGCNSVIATRTALKLADVVVTEAGFGADLGAEKFLDIKCPKAGLKPDAVVLVATIRALKYNGGIPKNELNAENLEALKKGIVNLEKHIENLQKYHVPVVVTLWKALTEQSSEYRPLYDAAALSYEEKVETVAKEIYGAEGVVFAPKAKKELKKIADMGYTGLPVCMAKTQYSLSDDPTKLGRPQGFTITVRDAYISAGAGFVVCLTGDIMTMPGLPKVPAAEGIDVVDGKITGLF